MKTKIAGIAKKLIPVLFNWLKKQALNKKESKLKDAGIAVVEIDETINKIKAASSDGIIDAQEMKEIAKESVEALLAVANLIGKTEIRIKKK